MSMSWKDFLRTGRRAILGLTVLLLAIFYFSDYLNNSARPSPHATFPEGWWGWFDQSKYLQSAQALARGDLSPDQHWYPFGYAILGAPFAWMGYHIYLIPDFLCLLVTAGGIIACATGIGVPLGVAAFIAVFCTMFPAPVRQVWAEPWNTTLACALIWTAFALSTRLIFADPARQITRHRVPLFFLFGAVLAFIPVTRPTDLLIAAPVAGATLLTALWYRQLRWKELLAACTGAAAVLGTAAALYLTIYGPRPSPYIIISRALGFRSDLLWWKIYTLLITPRPWFPDGEGMMEKMPWLFPGLTGAVLSLLLFRGRKSVPYALMAVLCLGYMTLFFSYVDLIPGGLWRYNNIHYFKWAFPALGILAWYALSTLFSDHRKTAFFTFVTLFALSCIRLLPTPEPATFPRIMMTESAEPEPSWPDTYFRDFQIRDQEGVLKNINDFRSLPDSHGERWIALSRPFDGTLTPLPPFASLPAPDRFWGLKVTFRPNPCWLPPHACRYKDPHP